MFRRKKTVVDGMEVPAELPPLEGLDDQPASHPRRTWLWTLIAALIVVFLAAYTLVLGIKAVNDGLRDRGLENQLVAQEHYELGLAYLEASDYELAIGEFELALRHDSSLYDARTHLREAYELVEAQVTPTSETRYDAARLLYQEAVSYYESGKLEQSVAALDELRGLDADYQRQNVEMMLANAHYQLGLNAVAEDRLEEAIGHFEAILAVRPDDKDAQYQLDLAHLYTAALNYWGRDWSATIQAFKGLHTLAPDYKDVQSRLRDAYLFHAQSFADQGEWCRAAEAYADAVEFLPEESTVDKRDDALMNCQATAEAPPPTATAGATAPSKPTAQATAGTITSLQVTPRPTATARPSLGTGKIAFTSYDAVRQRHAIYVIDLAQREARLLRVDANQPALAPGGRLLAFHNLDPSHLGLSVLDLSSNNLNELTTYAEDSTPTWSPDTEQIVFASNRHGDRKWRLYVISPHEVRGEGLEWTFGQMPAWSRDGSRIAYQGCDARGNECAVWVMQPGAFNPARLTSHPGDTAPAWSPDGTQVVFASTRAGNWELYLIEIATGQERRLTDHPASDFAPVWSPDGRQIAFLSNRDGGWAVYVLELKSGQVEQIIATGDAYPEPFSERLSWIP